MLFRSATLTTEHVARTVCDGKAGVFMHGPTFMGNPLACAVAAANMQILARNEWPAQVAAIEAHFQAALTPLRHEKNVADVRIIGAIGVVETRRPVNMAAMQAFFVEKGVWIRPFGKLIYLMPPFIIQAHELQKLTDAVAAAVRYEAGFS